MATRSRPISSKFLFLKALVLFVFWILLSASFEWIHLGLGLIFSFAVAWGNAGHSSFVPKFRLWSKILLYFPWLFYKIVKSSLHLSKLILHPALPIAPQLISVESKLNHHAAVVLLGNSITLTPGTITAEVNRNKLIVHALDNVLSKDIKNKQIESKISEIFRDQEPDL
jgi:multicomponent Na+:H+ antiporter subunit E